MHVAELADEVRHELGHAVVERRVGREQLVNLIGDVVVQV